MMRPTFEQVLEYLKTGEEDRQVESMIKHDPDGAEKLRQAKLMLELLSRRSGTKDSDEADIESGELLGSGLEQEHHAVAEAAVSYISDDEYVDHDVRKSSLRNIEELTALTRRAAGSIENLGTLYIAYQGQRHTTRFEPDWSLLEKRRSELDIFRSRADSQPEDMFDGIMAASRRPDTRVRINGSGIAILVEEIPPKSNVLRLRITDMDQGRPARALGIIFMPEQGAFISITTDDDGIAELAVPESSGTLRFESRQPQLLLLDVKK